MRLREVRTTNRVGSPTTGGGRTGDRVRAQSAPVELPGRGFHLVGAGRRARRSLPLRVPVVVDIGSGLLAAPPAARRARRGDKVLRAGAALVTASGDKLLGGPQCGLLSVMPTWCSGCVGTPFARACASTKLTLAARSRRRLCRSDPAGDRGARRPARELMARARRIAAAVDGTAVVSRGPGRGQRHPPAYLPSAAVAARWPKPLRCGDPSVVGHVHDGRLLLDLLTVPADLDDLLVRRCGAWRADVHVVATAGHVDHSKSTLVRALTSQDPDRLAEEKRRGLTIELGYCWTSLDPVGEVALSTPRPRAVRDDDAGRRRSRRRSRCSSSPPTTLDAAGGRSTSPPSTRSVSGTGCSS